MFDRIVHKIQDVLYTIETTVPMVTIRNKLQKSRFAIVGVTATTIDFTLLLTMSALGLNPIVANFISTTTSFCFSFIANRNYTFKATDGHVGRQVTLFVLVTLFGIWVLQPPVILFGEHFLQHSFGLQGLLRLALSKLAATAVTLLWNYYLYSRVVFKKPSADNRPGGE